MFNIDLSSRLEQASSFASAASLKLSSAGSKLSEAASAAADSLRQASNRGSAAPPGPWQAEAARPVSNSREQTEVTSSRGSSSTVQRKPEQASARFDRLLQQTPIPLKRLRQTVYAEGVPDGHTDTSRQRAIVWKLLLGYLPLEHAQWQEHLSAQRALYREWRQEITVDPHANAPGRPPQPPQEQQEQQQPAPSQQQQAPPPAAPPPPPAAAAAAATAGKRAPPPKEEEKPNLLLQLLTGSLGASEEAAPEEKPSPPRDKAEERSPPREMISEAMRTVGFKGLSAVEVADPLSGEQASAAATISSRSSSTATTSTSISTSSTTNITRSSSSTTTSSAPAVDGR